MKVFCFLIVVFFNEVIVFVVIEKLKWDSMFLKILYLLLVDWIFELFESWMKFMLVLFEKDIVLFFEVGLKVNVWLLDW